MNTVNSKSEWRRWWLVVIYAAAMAWVESAVVYYLRSMIDRIEPYQTNPLPQVGGFAPVELIREFATMVMLAAVGALAGRTRRARAGYTIIAFGVWDVFYYVFLKLMCGWPRSVWSWDILFLLPLPWWGPVLAPVLIALLMIVWGTLASQFEPHPPVAHWNGRVWALNAAGVFLALYLFMFDSINALPRGVAAVRRTLPHQFNWMLFGVALALMSAPVLHRGRQFLQVPIKPITDKPS